MKIKVMKIVKMINKKVMKMIKIKVMKMIKMINKKLNVLVF